MKTVPFWDCHLGEWIRYLGHEIGRLREVVTPFLFTMLVILTLAIPGYDLVNGNLYGEEKGEKSIRILLPEAPDVRNVGFCVAEKNGLFEREGLPPVKLQWVTNPVEKLKSVLNPSSDFAAIWLAEAIQMRAEGFRLVCLNLVYDHSTSCIVVRNDLTPELTRLSDLYDSGVSVWYTQQATAKAFFAACGLPVRVVIQRPNSYMLLNEGLVGGAFMTIDQASTMRYTSYRDSIKSFSFEEAGCDFPEGVIVCHEQLLEQEPDMCRKVVMASRNGMDAARRDIPMGVRILSEYCRDAGVTDNLFLLQFRLQTLIDHAAADTTGHSSHGQCSRERYESLVQAMIKAQVIKEEDAPGYEEMCIDILGDGPIAGRPPVVSDKEGEAPVGGDPADPNQVPQEESGPDGANGGDVPDSQVPNEQVPSEQVLDEQVLESAPMETHP